MVVEGLDGRRHGTGVCEVCAREVFVEDENSGVVSRCESCSLLASICATANENNPKRLLQSVYEYFPNLIQFRPEDDNEVLLHATQ